MTFTRIRKRVSDKLENGNIYASFNSHGNLQIYFCMELDAHKCHFYFGKNEDNGKIKVVFDEDGDFYFRKYEYFYKLSITQVKIQSAELLKKYRTVYGGIAKRKCPSFEFTGEDELIVTLPECIQESIDAPLTVR
jgi:hypothetical protein